MMTAECEDCGRPAHERIIDGQQFVLCDRCNDRLIVRVALDSKILEVVKLSRSDSRQALRILDDIYSAYRAMDHDGWLDRSVRSQRSLIFTDNGRFEDALAELRTIEQKLQAGTEEFVENKHAIADVLARSGNPQEAIRELDVALAYREQLDVGPLVGLLTMYARIAARHGSAVPQVYLDSFERVVREWGMPVPPDLISADLTQAILLAASQRLEAQDRYVRLLEELRGKSSEARDRLLREFAGAEPVGFFRDMAMRHVDEADEGNQ